MSLRRRVGVVRSLPSEEDGQCWVLSKAFSMSAVAYYLLLWVRYCLRPEAYRHLRDAMGVLLVARAP